MKKIVIAAAVVSAAALLGAAQPAHAAVRCTSALSGSLGPYSYRPITASNGSNTYVQNNMWGASGTGARQSVCALDPGHWTMRAWMPRGNTAVLTYPSVQQLLTGTSDVGRPVSSFSRITSRYAEHSPAGVAGDWEAAYDIWLSRTARSEIMIWTDNHGQTPAGRVTAHPVIYGQRWAVWDGGDMVSLVLNHRQPRGVVHILALLRWLAAHGYIHSSATVDQIQFGWEMCSTASTWRTFSVSQYNLVTKW